MTKFRITAYHGSKFLAEGVVEAESAHGAIYTVCGRWYEEAMLPTADVQVETVHPSASTGISRRGEVAL